MPFDKISPRQLLIMRIFTATTFMALGGAMVYLAGGCALDPAECTTRLEEGVAWAFPASAFVFGVFLANAGLMLLELVTPPPMKLAINVPFVAANFQTALGFGLVAVGPALLHATQSGTASAGAGALQLLTFVGVAMNLTFVVMTKLHWNFTENTGKALPKA